MPLLRLPSRTTFVPRRPDIALFCFTAWLAIVVLAFAIDVKQSGKSYWKTWEQTAPNWCERDHSTEFVREPSNAWSDTSFLAFGMLCIYSGLTDAANRHVPVGQFGATPDNFVAKFPPLSILNGLWNIVHAMGTFWNHSCRCIPGSRMDRGGMLAVSSFPLICTCYALYLYCRPHCKRGHVGVMVTYFLWGLFVCLIQLVPNSEKFDWILTVQIIVGLGLSLVLIYFYRSSHSMQYLLLMLAPALFGVGLKFWLLDQTAEWCDPEAAIQGHALWHVFCAVALCSIYYWLRTIEPLSVTPYVLAEEEFDDDSGSVGIGGGFELERASPRRPGRKRGSFSGDLSDSISV